MIGSIFDLGTIASVGKAAWSWLGATGGQAVPVPVVVQQIKAGNSRGWHETSMEADRVAMIHSDVSLQVNGISKILTEAWVGEGANKAQDAIKPFVATVEQAAKTYSDNAFNVRDAAEGFDYAHTHMEDMPERPEKSGWDTITPWDTDKEDEINRYNDLAQRNLQLYNNYSSHTSDLGSTININYGSLAPLDDGPTPNPGGGIVDGGAKTSNTGDTSGPRSSGGAVHTPNVSGGPGVVTPHVPAGQNPPAHLPTPGPGSGLPDDGTRAAGFTPPSVPPTVGPGGGQLGPLVPGGGPLPGSGPGSVPVVGVGGIPGAGGAPGVGGPGSGNTGGPGAGGKGTGAVPGLGAPRPGMAMPPGVVTTPGGGRAGMPMAGMPGAAGGRGPQSEDSEHERKYGLTDSTIFEPDADEDGLLDPTTGQRAVPPTIGT